MTTSASPMASPLPWTRAAWERLWQGRQLGRMPHALLLCGPLGVGKRVFAEALIRALLCSAPRSDGLACGACQDCHLLAIGGHPDRLTLGLDPEGTGNEIRVESARELLDSEALTPHRGQRKVVLIDPAHRLNRSAANSLLKTLEEPCPTTTMILVTEDPGRLPATVRSRCQKVSLQRPSEDEALTWLAPRVDGQDGRLLLRLAQGAPLRALALLEDGLLAQREERLTGLRAVLRGARDPVNEANAWLDAKPGLLFEWLGSWISDLLRLAIDPACPYLSNPDKRMDLRQLAPELDLAATHRYLQRVLQARARVESNINKQLLYESLLIDLARLGSGID